MHHTIVLKDCGHLLLSVSCIVDSWRPKWTEALVSLLNSDLSWCSMWCSGAAPEAGDGAQWGGEKQRKAAEEPPGTHRVHTHAEDYTNLHPQPLQSKCVSDQLLIYHTYQPSVIKCILHSVCISQSRCFVSPCQQHLVFLSLMFFVSLGDKEVELFLINDMVTIQPLQAVPDSSRLRC